MLRKYYKIILAGLGAVAVVTAMTIVVTGIWNSNMESSGMSLLLRDRHGHFLAQVLDSPHASGYGYWPVKELPQRVVEATLALEDKRFRLHPGVDPIAAARALWQNISNQKRISGASTIAMQVARMQNPSQRTYFRKAVEAVSAVAMTIRYGRDQVLHQYLKIVPYGQNCHGIAYASRLFLNKPVEDLSWAEIAFLSAIPHAPGRMNLYTTSGRRHAVKRGKKILNVLYEKKLMSFEEYQLGLRQIDNIHIPEKNQRPHYAMHPILKLEKLYQQNRLGDKKELTPLVYTTLDLDLQLKTNRLASRLLHRWKSKGASHVSAIITRRTTGEVLAYLGSQDYFFHDSGAIDYASTKRSPGSTLKPFIYALAMERGHLSPGTVIDDLPNNAQGFSNQEMKFLGPMLPRQALANSRNIPAVTVLGMTGIDETCLFLKSLGLHPGIYEAEHYGLGMALGSLPVTLETLVQAYSVLANDGRKINNIWLADQKNPPSAKIISRDISRLITLYLSDPMARLPSFPRMGTMEYPFPVAVKTGTSQGYRDAWSIAYSKEYLVGVWVGRADNKSMNKLGGAGSSAHLAQYIMLHLHRNQTSGTADLSLPLPEDYVPVRICAHTGKRASNMCEHTIQEWFAPDQVPEFDKSHKILAIDDRNGLLATRWTPKNRIRTSVFLDLPSRYAAWTAAKGFPKIPDRYSPLNIPEGESVPVYASSVLEDDIKISIQIDEPKDGAKIIANPETPLEMNSMALRLTLNKDMPQVLWYVDGMPYKIAEAPYTVRWPLKKGTHTFQAKLPYRNEVSEKVRVFVQYPDNL